MPVWISTKREQNPNEAMAEKLWEKVSLVYITIIPKSIFNEHRQQYLLLEIDGPARLFVSRNG